MKDHRPGGRIGMTVETTRRFRYGSCDAHASYRTKQEARRLIREHRRSVAEGWLRCQKCARGMVPDPFRCPVNGSHFHWGHESRTDTRTDDDAVYSESV